MRAPQDMPGRQRRPRRPGRGRVVLVIGVVLLFVLFTSLRSIASFYTDYLWFESVGQTGVWRGVLGTKLVLAGLFIAVFFGLMWANLFIADRIAPMFRPAGPEEEMIERYHRLIRGRQGLVRLGVAGLFALIAGAPAAAEWNEWLLFRNRVPFGIDDPQFGKDIGFYVFQLPFLTFLVTWMFAAFAIVLVVTAVAHYMNGGIRVQTPGQRVTPQVKAHLSVLLGVLALVKAAGYYLQQFELTTSTRGTVDGATYTDVNAQLPAIRLLILISLAALVLFIVNIFRRGWVLPVLGVGLWMFIALVAGGAVPAFIQKVRVEPSESSRERPFIEHNILATRAAYGLDSMVSKPFEAGTGLTAAGLADNQDTVSNIRIWDPARDRLGQTYQQLQALQPFYDVSEVDTDRYEVDGRMQQVMIAARELNVDGIPQKSWEATHLAFTHGYGVVASPAAAQVQDGRPEFVLRDIPVKAPDNLRVDEPGLYFGDGLAGYVIVNTNRQEIDYQGPEGRTEFRNYEGADGIELGSIVRRAAFALRFGDINTLVSGNLTESSKVLIYRDVRSRVQAIAPFLSYDADPYPVVVGGRVKWIVDAYTTSARYPYSQRAINDERTGLSGRYNYVRNSVKAVVDAYDGTITMYIVDPGDPIAQAYRKAFPKLFTAEEAPPEIQAHFRYPEDLFRVQTNMWGRYHVTDPDTFYNNSDTWVVARNPGTETQRAGTSATATSIDPSVPPSPQNRVDPYYLLMRLPGEDKLSFLIFRPFSPVPSGGQERQQLTAFMVAKSDPGEYGDLETLVMNTDNLPDGPVLVANTMQSDPNVSRLQTELGVVGGGSDLLFGNLITIPIEESLLYVRPVYVQAADNPNPLPLLRKVIVEFDKKVSVADTLPQALRGLERFRDLPPLIVEQEGLVTPPTGSPTTPGEPPTTPPPTTTTVPGGPPPTVATGSPAELLARADTLFQEADAALAQSPPDFAGYSARTNEARELVRQASEQLGAPPPATTAPPPTAPSSTATTGGGSA